MIKEFAIDKKTLDLDLNFLNPDKDMVFNAS
jgi:hypothetical protein